VGGLGGGADPGDWIAWCWAMAKTDEHHRRFGSDFKRFFGRGLGILLPSIVTLWLLWQAFVFVFNTVAEPINRSLRVASIRATPMLYHEDDRPSWYTVTPEQISNRALARRRDGLSELPEPAIERQIRLKQFRDEWDKHWYLDGLGFVVAIILIYLSGLLLGNYLGRQVYGRIEQLIAKIPGFKQVYPHVKQVVDLIFGENSTMKAFSETVLVQYPSKGIWSMGFVTGNAFSDVRAVTGVEVVSVFIPTSPTPMTGFVINVPRSEAVKVDISIDQALRFIITAGVLTPEHVDAGEGDKGASKLLSAHEAAERAFAAENQKREDDDEGDDGSG
jgi:uncharacterized membrane protein